MCKHVQFQALVHLLGVFTIRQIFLSRVLGNFSNALEPSASDIATGSFAKYRADVILHNFCQNQRRVDRLHRLWFFRYMKRWAYHKSFCYFFAPIFGSRHTPVNEFARPFKNATSLLLLSPKPKTLLPRPATRNQRLRRRIQYICEGLIVTSSASETVDPLPSSP
jgi:hypothetical protein